MKILFVQESDWLIRNSHQQHHLAELMSLRGHEIRVIDYEILWKSEGKKELYSRREVFTGISKINPTAKVTVIRPSIVKVYILDYVSLLVSHRNEVDRQVSEFSPDVIVGWSILNSYLAAEVARKNKIPFIYYWIDVLHKLIPFAPLRPLGKFVESRTLGYADRVLLINSKLRDYVIKLGASPERTGILKAGVNIDQFNPNTDTKYFCLVYCQFYLKASLNLYVNY